MCVCVYLCICVRVYVYVGVDCYECVNRSGGEGGEKGKRKTSLRCNDAEGYECAIAGI